MGTAAPLLIYRICLEFVDRTATSIRPHPPQNWVSDKNIIHEMTQVHGEDNAYLLRIQSIVGYKTLKIKVLSCRKERQQVAVKMKLTRR